MFITPKGQVHNFTRISTSPSDLDYGYGLRLVSSQRRGEENEKTGFLSEPREFAHNMKLDIQIFFKC